MDSRFMSFRGIRVHFCVSAPDDAVKHRVLMVTSPLGDTGNYRQLTRLLSEAGCLCVIVDLPGFGRSDCGEFTPQDNETRARILWGILDCIDDETDGGPERWHLVGHGSGCGAVMAMALDQPDSVHSKVLISPVLNRLMPPPFPSLLTTGFGMWAFDKWYKRNLLDKKRFRRLIERMYGARLPRERLRALQKPLTRDAFFPMLVNMLKSGYSVPPTAFQGFEPVMLFWGGRDPYFGGQVPARIRKCFEPGSAKTPDKTDAPKPKKRKNGDGGVETHIIRAAAHYAMETHADIIADYLRGWFRYVEGGK